MTIPGDIARDVGDMHTQTQHAINLVKRDGIVEVLGIGWIDGEDVAHAQIMPTGLGKGRLHVDLDAFGLLERLGTELRGKVEVVDDDVDIHARGIRRTEHLDHISLHRLPTIGIARDARQDDVAVMGPARMPIGNEEVVPHARILCDDHGQRVVDLERTDEVFGRATHHACDLGGSLASIGHVTRAHPKLHLVAGHGAAKRERGTKKLPSSVSQKA